MSTTAQAARARLNAANSSSTDVLRIQPVEPVTTPKEFVAQLVATVGSLALSSWFICLATLAASDHWPSIPAFGYWESVALLLGLNTLARVFRPAPWKWARK